MARIGVFAVATLAAWAQWRLRAIFQTPSESQNTRDDFVARRAERAVAVLGRLKGAFAKAGQFAAVRHDLLPARAMEALATLRDRVPPLPPGQIRALVARELGADVPILFADFDDQPLGAASIGQVHRATLPDGTPVAVKIQYPWLAAALPSDLSLLRRVARIVLRLSGRAVDDADFERFFTEFTLGLSDELDFVAEAAAAREIAENLADQPAVVVPEVFTEYSTARVLTMRFHPSINIADDAALDARGVPRAGVLEVLARAYAKQVFVDGLFHADPHPGNLFVIDEPEAASAPRVLFVDFGLCRRLDPGLRQAMRLGIYAVLQRDVDAFLDRMRDMQMIAPGAAQGVRAAVEAMFARLAETGGGTGMLGASSSMVLALKDEAKALLQETPGLQLPNDLLLYAKTLSYLFALGEALDPDVDLMKISIPYLLRFLAHADPTPTA